MRKRRNFWILEISPSISSWLGSLETFVSCLTAIFSCCMKILHMTVTQIYGVPTATKGLYIHQVHSILNQLRAWQDELPSDMRVVEQGTPRPVASLHLAYHQCIIQTTRPVLLHLFKAQFKLDQRQSEQQPPQDVSAITLALAESCVNAAQASSRIVESLFLDGSIATFGFWDAHHIFSAAMILIISAIMKPTTSNSDQLETLLSVLRSLKSNGNIPAVDFCERLSQIQTRVSTLRSLGRLKTSNPATPSSRSPQPRPPDSAREHPPHTPVSVQSEAPALEATVPNPSETDILGDPIIGSFLDDHQMQWLDSILPEGGIPFTSDFEELFPLGGR